MTVPTATPPDPSLLHLLWPKWLTARARTIRGERGRGFRFAVLGFFGLLFWAFIFGILYRLLAYFRGVAEIGPLLDEKMVTAFRPQSVPFYAATQNFLTLHKKHPDYSYKEATLNPTNPRDRATH